MSNIKVIYDVFVRPWPWYMITLILIGLISGAIPYFQVMSIRMMVDQLETGLYANQIFIGLLEVLPWLLLFAGSILVDFLVKSRNLLTFIGTYLEVNIRKSFYPRFLMKSGSLPLEILESPPYYEKIEQIRESFKHKMIVPLLNLQRFVAYSVTLIVILVQLGAANIWIPVCLLLSALLMSRMHILIGAEQWKLTQEETSLRRRAAYWGSLLLKRENAMEMRVLNLSQHALGNWKNLSDEHMYHFKRLSYKQIALQVPLVAIQLLLSVLAYGLLIYEALRGSLELGHFMALIFLILQMENELDPLGKRLQSFSKLLMQMKNLHAFLHDDKIENINETSSSSNIQDSLKDKTIRFEQVSFAYPGSNELVISNLNLSIREGERIAIVGQNGAGKSTIAKLLLGLYQPTSGRVTFGGVPLPEVSPEIWQQHVTAILQDFTRYQFSVQENIGFGQLDKMNDMDAIVEAAKITGAHDFITRLPKLYKTRLGREFKEGEDLSLGQWQKLALARAYLRQANVIVFDEPTSALDPIAELEIFKQLLKIAEGKSVLLISHRLGSARLADRIIVVKGGAIVESGHHDELIRKNGEYATMYRLQAQWYQDEIKSEMEKMS